MPSVILVWDMPYGKLKDDDRNKDHNHQATYGSFKTHNPSVNKNAMPSHCETRKDGETRRTHMALVMLTLYQLTVLIRL